MQHLGRQESQQQGMATTGKPPPLLQEQASTKQASKGLLAEDRARTALCEEPAAVPMDPNRQRKNCEGNALPLETSRLKINECGLLERSRHELRQLTVPPTIVLRGSQRGQQSEQTEQSEYESFEVSIGLER